MKIKAIAVLVILFLASIAAIATPTNALPWYNSFWTKRAPVVVNNLTPNNLADYQVKISVPYDSDMKSDFSDLRFTDSDGSTLLKYWVEGYIASASAIVWVKVPSIPGTGSTTIYMYYGNPTATSESNIKDTFILGDDFNDGILDTSLWTEGAGAYNYPYTPLPGGYLTETSGELYIRTELQPGLWWVQTRYIVSNSPFSTTGTAFDYQLRVHLGEYSHRTGLFIIDRFLTPPDGMLDRPPTEDYRGLLSMTYTYWPQTGGEDWLDILKMMNGNEYQLLRTPWTNDDEYVSLSIRLTDTQMAFVENGIEVLRTINDLPFGSGYIYANSGGRGSFGSPYLSEAYYDNIRVRKYVEPEPTTSIGAEESTDAKGSIQNLIETIKTWSLPKGTENSLTSKLQSAIQSLDQGQKNAAINKLGAFINEVQAQRNKKLTKTQADTLISEAQSIISKING